MTVEPFPMSPPPPREPDPFRYGWRDVPQTRADGIVTWERIPLTLEDVLHPRENDVIPQNTQHEREQGYVANVCRAHLVHRPDALVLSNCLIDWGQEDLQALCPDIAPVVGVRDPRRPRSTFYVAREGTRPLLIVEIISLETRVNDVERKVEEYYRAGVPVYVIVDEEWEGAPRRVLAYRHTPQGYQEVALDERGRVRLEPLGIWLGLRDNKVVCWEAAPEEEFGDYTQVCQAREAAERRARAEAEARQTAEKQLRELEAELRRLRGQDPH
jgi:colicin import membrane protein